MKKVRSSKRPSEIEFTPTSVLIASDITPYEEEMDGHTLSVFEYNCTEYSKDEYLALQAARIAELSEELAAAKILLGVD